MCLNIGYYELIENELRGDQKDLSLHERSDLKDYLKFIMMSLKFTTANYLHIYTRLVSYIFKELNRPCSFSIYYLKRLYSALKSSVVPI